MKYLLIEDNTELASALCDRMRLDGHVIDHATTLSEGADFLHVGEYDLILLDIMLPDGDGRRFLERHRAQANDTPVIVLTARSEVSDRVGMLDLGADDYLTKPFDMDELEARVRALSRRRAQPVETQHAFGGLVFNLQTRSLSGGGSVLDLPRREVAVIDALMTAQGRVVAKAELIEQVYGTGADVEESAIEVHVSRLRKRLRPHGVDIRAQRGLGYRLVVT